MTTRARTTLTASRRAWEKINFDWPGGRGRRAPAGSALVASSWRECGWLGRAAGPAACLAATSRRSLCHRRGGLHRGLAAGARQSSTRKLRSPPPGTWCVARGRSGQGSSPHVSVLWHNHRRAPPEREHGELRLRRAGAATRDPTWVMADGRLRLLCQFLMFGRT